MPPGDPEARVLAEAAEMGYTMYVGAEAEFFCSTDAEGKPTTITHDNAGYFDLGPVDQGDARREMCRGAGGYGL